MKETVLLNGVKWSVRADYRKAMAIIRVLTDPALEMLQEARVLAALKIFYEDFDALIDFAGAYDVMRNFMNFGSQGGPRLVDFKKDWRDILSAVNKSAGQPVRNMAFLHIEDFFGYLQERVPESTISYKINIRYALANGKFSKLPKELKEYCAKNKADVDLEQPQAEAVAALSEEEQEKVLAEFNAIKR